MSTKRRLVLAVVAIIAYASVTGIAIFRSWPHYELLGIFLRYAVLLPALVYALRAPGLTSPAFIPMGRPVVIVAAFLIASAFISWHIGQGQTIPDESAYRFEARILASGKFFAPAPIRAPERTADVPRPFRFNHLIISPEGWYSKYPLGWPAVLALPQKLHLGWLVNPVLAALLLAIIGLVVREAFAPITVFPAVAMAALSPYFLAYSVEWLSHAFSAVLVALGCLFFIQGAKTGKLSRFGWMFLVLILSFQVRPFTALMVSAVLGFGALAATWKQRALFRQVFMMGIVSALMAALSILLYNYVFTGSALLSPYAVAKSAAIPRELQQTASGLLRNLASIWRFSAQDTALYFFPFVIPLAVCGLWVHKRMPAIPWVLLALPCALVLGHLVQVESSSSVIGERYWFEGYFGLIALAAAGLTHLIAAWRPERRILLTVIAGLSITQLVIMAGVVAKLNAATRPTRDVWQLAENYHNCNCVVYLEGNGSIFRGEHLNLNGPDWPSAKAFFAIDPGPGERGEWASVLHKPRWVVVTYDAQHKAAKVDATGSL